MRSGGDTLQRACVAINISVVGDNIHRYRGVFIRRRRVIHGNWIVVDRVDRNVDVPGSSSAMSIRNDVGKAVTAVEVCIWRVARLATDNRYRTMRSSADTL